MSKLASIQKIIKIEPIKNSDNIELAFILGWQVVVKKGEFKAGDKICYIEIDTVVPEKPEFEFLRNKNFRVRTIKLRGALSQGLIIPAPKGDYKEGDDITDIIGVKKYEKPDNNPNLYEKPRKPKKGYKKWIYLFKYNILYKIFPQLRKKSRSPFPTHLVSKTDEIRIQSIPETLEQYKGKDFIVSYKLDGSSITIIHSKILGRSKFRICSRRFELHDKNNDWYKVFSDTNFKIHILKLIKLYKTNDIIVQGEAIGKFNGNHHNLKKNEIRLFNIYINGKRLLPEEFKSICEILDIPHCPVLMKTKMNYTMEEILKLSEIKDILNENVQTEGLVWRCVDDGFSFKVINNNFLIENKE